MPTIAIAYFFLACMVAYLARGTQLGPFRAFVFSLIVTPPMVILYLLIATSLDRDAAKRQAREDAERADR